MAISFAEIGARLKAYRLGQSLSADAIAARLDLSRAAVYRIEAGAPVKVETLERLAAVLDTSVGSLLGVGVEYYANAISYFERMRQVEEQCDQVVAHFPPMSYLLTSADYPIYMKKMLLESMPATVDAGAAEQDIDTIIEILTARKRVQHERRLSIVNFVTLPEIERWLKLGVIGRFDLDDHELGERRLAARREVEHLIDLVERAPMGIQIAVLEETLPNLTFQLFRAAGQTILGLSPYRLGGELPNVRMGVAMITADAEPVRLYETLTDDLWARAAKGKEAVRLLSAVLARSAVQTTRTRKAS
jgi:transcriptional regulator with XRE-family HTH domain